MTAQFHLQKEDCQSFYLQYACSSGLSSWPWGRLSPLYLYLGRHLLRWTQSLQQNVFTEMESFLLQSKKGDQGAISLAKRRLPVFLPSVCLLFWALFSNRGRRTAMQLRLRLQSQLLQLRLRLQSQLLQLRACCT